MRQILVVGFVLVLGQPLLAQEIDSSAMDKAKEFLNARKRGELINGFCHFGTKYLGHEFKKTHTVQDKDGRKVPGHFALVFDHKWSDGGETQLAFLCDTRGNVYGIQVLACNGVVQRPFAIANASIKLVGAALYESVKDNLQENDRQLLRQLIDSADAQGLLQLGLRIQQSNGQ